MRIQRQKFSRSGAQRFTVRPVKSVTDMNKTAGATV
jgi:hypothetical protein